MKKLPDRPDPKQLRTQAKELRRALAEDDPEAKRRVLQSHPKFAGRPAERMDGWTFTLRDAQVTIAREYGFDSWKALLAEVEGERVVRLEDDRWPQTAGRAFIEARELGHEHCSGEHLLLALLSPPLPTTASKVFAELGIQYDEVRAAVKRRARSTKRSERGVSSTPVLQSMLALARGIAIGMGDSKVSDEHLAISLAYADRHAGGEVYGYEFDPDELLARLDDHGVEIPSIGPPVPETPMGPWGPMVYFRRKDFQSISQELTKRYPVGSAKWGWNVSQWRRGYNYVHGEDGIPMEEIIRGAVQDADSVIVLSFIEGGEREAAARARKKGTEP